MKLRKVFIKGGLYTILMANNKLILMSLDDEKINRIANVVSNESSKKILDYLSGRDYATESEISKELGIAISTIHYNIQQLIDAGLVSSDEFHYSEKGREVNRYSLANKYIIIAPKGTKKAGLRQKLRSILPIAIISVATAGILEWSARLINAASLQASKQLEQEPMLMASKTELVQSASPAAGAPEAAAVVQSVQPLWQNMALWFLIGAFFAIILFIIFSWFRKTAIE